MRITKLILEQFRNYRHLELDFDIREPMTYIVGPNAQGKTNILESIYVLALTKSFRTSNQQDMIGWEDEYARVKGFFEIAATNTALPDPAHTGRPDKAADGQTEALELECFLGKPPHPRKAFRKNSVKTGAANFIGNCQVVFFHPEDLNMLYLGPDLRRAYLNVMNVQVNRKYFTALRAYQKVLKQRNALLHAIRENRMGGNGHVMEDELDIWDEQLVEHGSFLLFERSKTVNYFEQKLAETYRKISNGDEKISMIYHHTLTGAAAYECQSQTLQDWHELFAEHLAKNRARDLQALVTTVGPHRDDLEFSLNGLKLAALASRGEYRSLLLALKLIELEFFEEQSGQKPILLLDDVFSELDPKRQALLLDAINGHQTIITTTHIDRDHQGLKSGRPGKLLEIHQGTIHEHTA